MICIWFFKNINSSKYNLCFPFSLQASLCPPDQPWWAVLFLHIYLSLAPADEWETLWAATGVWRPQRNYRQYSGGSQGLCKYTDNPIEWDTDSTLIPKWIWVDDWMGRLQFWYLAVMVQLEPYEQTLMKFELKHLNFIQEMNLKMSAKWWTFCLGLHLWKATHGSCCNIWWDIFVLKLSGVKFDKQVRQLSIYTAKPLI